MRRKRYGPVGSSYNSKKYLAMHNANISAGLRCYHARKRGEVAPIKLGEFVGTMLILAGIMCFAIGLAKMIAH